MKSSSKSPSSIQNPTIEPSLDDAVAALGETLRRLVHVGRRLDDEQFRKQVLLRLQRQQEQLEQLAQGKLVFDSTETWRSVYEEVLSACTLKRYLSVALVRTEEYWRDVPGDRSIRFNGMLVDYGYYVHRIVIVDAFLWPPAAQLPSKGLYAWIMSQFQQGIQIGLVRASELTAEADLLVDFGIYGDAAAGYQLADELGQTIRYEMLFGVEHVRAAEDRWKRLSLYAHPLESI